MPNIQRIWNRNDQNIANNIIERKSERDQELVRLFKDIRSELASTAENRNMNKMIKRIGELEKEEVAARSHMQTIIEKYENTCCGSLSMNSAKGFAWCLKVIGFFGVIISIIELLLERFTDQNDPLQTTTTSIFTIAAAIFTAIVTCGMTIECLGQRAINKAMKYRKFTWEERRELKILLKYFKEIKALHMAELEITDQKFNDLVKKSSNIPFTFEGATIFNNTAELINYLLLSLPANHPIRQKLDTLEQFATTASLPDSPPSSSFISIEDASQGTSETDIESGLPEPDVETIPTVDTDFFCHYCVDRLENGQTFEKGILKNVIPTDLDRQRTTVENLISRKAAICLNWIDIENYAGPTFDKFVINGIEIPRYKIFREMSYQQFRKRVQLL